MMGQIPNETVCDGYVTIVLPCFNERATITDVVEQTLESLEGTGYDGHIVIVDDDSPDGTGRFAQSYFDDDDRVEVMIRLNEHGLSSAILDGLFCSVGRYAIVMDADGQHPPERIPEIVSSLEDSDIVVGSRHIDGGSIEGWPIRRRVISSVATTIASLSIPSARRLQDPMSGFFGIDRTTVDVEVLQQCDPHGYKLLLELLSHAEQLGDINVDEIPITFRERQGGESKMTVDEAVRFVEHCTGLGLVERGVAKHVYPPLLIRSVEFGAVTGVGLIMLYLGLWIGNVDGALGASLIAAAGGLVTLAALRYQRTRKTWNETDESYVKS